MTVRSAGGTSFVQCNHVSGAASREEINLVVPQVESQNRLMRLVSSDTSSYEECVCRFRIHLIFLDSASGNFDKTLCRRSPEDKFCFFLRH